MTPELEVFKKESMTDVNVELERVTPQLEALQMENKIPDSR